MNKREFLDALRLRLKGVPTQVAEDGIAFYSEIIDDLIEDGKTEEEAVAEIGTVEDAVTQILADVPLMEIARERFKPKRKMRTWEIVLLVVGSPLWISLGVAAFAVLLALYAVLWSLIVSLWAVFVSVAASGVCSVVIGVCRIVLGNVLSGVALIGAGIVCIGLAILLFVASVAATKGMAVLSKKIALGIKRCFVGKERE